MDTLQLLKTKMDQALLEKEKQVFYREELLPVMLQLRKRNRIEKNKLELNHNKVRDLNKKLINLQHECECLDFEASCLSSEIEGVKPPTKTPLVNGFGNHFDVDIVSQLDHQTRIQKLEEEETKRKKLIDQLSQLEEETKSIEIACSNNANKVNNVKPYIKQLLEKTINL